jgi:drug/metabolite transporter (DMT)-like permease
VIAFALIDGSLFEGFLVEGLQSTGAGLGSVLIDTQPLAVAVMAAALYSERIGWIGWLSMGVGACGIFTIGLAPEWGANGLVLENVAVSGGTVLMLLSALSMAIATVMMRRMSQHVDPVVATGWHMVLGSLPLIAWSAATETHQWDLLPPEAWWGVLYIAAFTSALAYALFFYCASRENLTQFSSLTFLTPVFALLLGYICLSETLTNVQWAGAILTLASVFAMHQRDELAAAIRSWAGSMRSASARARNTYLEPEAVDVRR